MRLLDLFCGAGLAGAGYWQSGCFSEIVGVDLDPAMKGVYPFDFVCRNAYTLDYDFLMGFDFIHASPPCQFYSAITPSWARANHLRSIPGTHLMLKAAGVPHVIENVPGSGHDLRPNLVMRGRDVGLPLDRPRLFHINGHSFSEISSSVSSHVMSAGGNIKSSPGSQMSIEAAINVHGDVYVSRDEMIRAFGLKTLAASHLRRLTISHIEQGIPPAMTKAIAALLLPKVMIA